MDPVVQVPLDLPAFQSALVGLGWLPPKPSHEKDEEYTKQILMELAASNADLRDRLLLEGWRPDRSKVVCVGQGSHQRCTYEAFISFFDYNYVPAKRITIPSYVPHWLRSTYLWWNVGSYQSRFPIDWPL